MPFASSVYREELVLDDDYDFEHEVFVTPPEQSKGFESGLRGTAEYAYGDVAQAFPQHLLIPEGDWEGMIKEQEERKSRLSDLVIQAGLPVKNQQRTNYCWIYGPTAAVEMNRLKQNQKMVMLSAASAGSKIKNFRNVGGWGKEGLQFIVDYGLVPETHWPNATISRQYDTAENWELAKRYKVERWLELRPRNLNELMSCLLRRIPVAVGYNWWGHEVVLTDAVWVNNRPGGRMRNSWGPNWPNAQADGWSILQGSKLLPDDAVCPLSTTAA